MTIRKILLAAGLSLAASAASAATVSFVGSAQGTDYQIDFSDDTAGLIDVTVTATANPNNADLFGLAFDWLGTPAPVGGTGPNSDFSFVSSNTGEGIVAVCVDTLSCGGGLNFNGTGVTAFDYIIRMGSAGLFNGQYLNFFNFTIASGLALDDFLGDSFGIRAQSTGPTGDDSLKLIDFERVPPIPVPAAGFMLLLGLGGLAAVRRRKTPA